MEKRRLEYLDVARGIAMISILLGHLGEWSIIRVVFTYHLPIFYLISGYFFDVKSSLMPFIKKKVRQLLVPYYIACLLFELCYIAMNLIYHDPWRRDMRINLIASLYAAGDSWPKPFDIRAIGAIWFLWAMFWAVLMLKLLLKCRPAVRLLSVAAIFGLSCWSWRIIWLPLSLQAGGCALLFVYLGYLLRQLLPRLKEANLSAEIKAVGAILALAMWLWCIHTFKAFWLVHCEIGNGMCDILGSLCGCVILLLLSAGIDRWIRPLARPLAFYGRYSLLFLSFHLVELNSVRYWELYPGFLSLFRLTDSHNLHLWFLILAKLVLITLLMLALYRVPIVRRIYGYPPLERRKEGPSHE